MPIKPIAAGTPQRIIAKINEIIGAVNTGGSGGSGTADAILDAATIADAGKALGIDAEGEPALITVSGGGAPILRCSLTYTGEGTEADPYIGHLDHASDILDALDHESPYDPIIVVAYELSGVLGQLLPTVAEHFEETTPDGVAISNRLNAYGLVGAQYISDAILFGVECYLGETTYGVEDYLSGISARTVTIADDVISFTNPTE